MSRAVPADAAPADRGGPLEPTGDPNAGPPPRPGRRDRLSHLVHVVRARVTRPPTVRPYLLGELVVVLFLLKLYDVVREHADLRKGDAIRSGRDLFNFEKWLHIDIEPSINHWTVAHHSFNYIFSYWYQFAHITISMLVLAWCWWCRPAAYRMFRNALVMINIAGLTVFLLFPVAPPRLLPGSGFIDADRLVGFGSNNVGPVTADSFGAFPSLHIAWAVWVVAVTYTLVRSPVLARVWIVYPFLTLLAIVATGNHFVLDAVAGAILSLAALKVARLRWDRSASSTYRASRPRGGSTLSPAEPAGPPAPPA